MVVQVAGFTKNLSFEEAIRLPGKDVEAPARPYTRLRDSIKLNAFIGATLEEIHERSLKAEEASRKEREVRAIAAEQGIPVGQARGPGGGKDRAEANASYAQAVDPGHEERKQANVTRAILQQTHEQQQVEKRKRGSKAKFNETLAPPGSIAEAILEAFTWAGEVSGRGAGGVVGLHMSQTGGVTDPATATAFATAGSAVGGMAGRKVAKQVGEAALRAAPARDFRPTTESLAVENPVMDRLNRGGEM